ncbi:MAG: hypothetical protein Q4G34_03705 [Micrococcus sp.]|nr:hypothetical protein [Micrococcus sp.]
MSADGSFALAAIPTPAVREQWAADGYVNASIVAFVGDSPVAYDLTLFPDGSTSEDEVVLNRYDTSGDILGDDNTIPGLDPVNPTRIEDVEVDLASRSSSNSTNSIAH